MSIIESAKAELARSSFAEEDKAVIIDIMERFFAQWDSGGAVSVMIPVMDRLLRALPLSPLSGEDSEWYDPMGDRQTLQNIRSSNVFKRDGKAYDIDEPAWDGSFPYMPAAKGLATVMEITG